MNNSQIENILRRAPQPKPPGTLAQRLKAQALNTPRYAPDQPKVALNSGSFLSRWWAALAPAAVSIACAAGLTMQHLEINKLKAAAKEVAEQRPPSTVSQGVSSPLSRSGTTPQPTSVSDQQELSRLRTLAAQLRAEVSGLEKVRGENERLRAQLASGSSGVLSADEMQALEGARQRAMRIQCVNSMKQLALAVRVWSLDNHNMTPPNVLSMSNEMGSFSILVCPADTGREAAKDSASFTPANCSYEYLAPAARDNESDRILFRCPVHGNIALCDGSVQSSIGKEHPDWIVQLDGKYYMRRPSTNAEGNNPAPASQGQNQ